MTSDSEGKSMTTSLRQLVQENLDPDNPAHRDPDFIREVAWPLLRHVGTYYFRLEWRGTENLPKNGESFLAVGNHSGGPILPDVWLTAVYWWDVFGIETPAYAMVHDLVFRVPVLRNILIKVGALRASRSNAAKVLEMGGTVLVYPGGAEEAQRSFWRRNQIDFRGRTGFIELALQYGVPILPVVNVGAHEVYFTLFSSRLLAQITGLSRLTGLKTLPLNIGLPWGVWLTGFLPYIPLPSKIVFDVGKPVYLPKDPELAKNRSFVREVYFEITRTMQKMVDELARERRFPVLG